jgi:uncharacterized delta-60 repeat protein
VLARYTADGWLDSEFADAGRAVLESGGDDQVAGLALDSEGRLLVAGSLANEFLLLRLLPNGALDDSFGGGGRVVGGLSTMFGGAHALVIQPDRKPVLGGVAPSQSPTSLSDYFGPHSDFVLVRYLAT